jgi:polyisoprenoid-binding protein YceI
MNISRKIISFSFVLLLQVGFGLLVAQNVFTIGSQQELKVTGTSTLHDWEMKSDGASGQATLILDGKQIKEVQNLRVQFPVKSLTSGSNRMDRTAYSSIDADKHPNVSFVLSRVRNITAGEIVADGNLTIAGETRPVTLKTKYEINGNTIRFTGAEQIKFSQFNVAPPTALMGTVKTGDELKIAFDVNFTNSSTSAR